MKYSFAGHVKLRYNLTALKVGILYFILLAGALWNLLDQFEHVMAFLGSPIIIGLAIWLSQEYLSQMIRLKNRIAAINFFKWIIFVVVGSIFIEWLGVHTGLIFGHYQYGQNLPPYIGGVPVAIGFAWLGMVLSSIGFAHHVYPPFSQKNVFVSSFVIAALMTLFDVFMEPAATKLGYWSWNAENIPVQNYLAWFTLSYGFIQIGFRMNLFKSKPPVLAFHAFIAQLSYFIITNL